jgi:hypothetical protein
MFHRAISAQMRRSTDVVCTRRKWGLKACCGSELVTCRHAISVSKSNPNDGLLSRSLGLAQEFCALGRKLSLRLASDRVRLTADGMVFPDNHAARSRSRLVSSTRHDRMVVKPREYCLFADEPIWLPRARLATAARIIANCSALGSEATQRLAEVRPANTSENKCA